MKKITCSAALSILLTLFIHFTLAVVVHAGPLPDTGQTKCYDNSDEIASPTEGQPFYGQDGNYLINPPSYTKLDASGNALPGDAAAWAMIKDDITGLVWENKANDGSIHDGSKTFAWCDKNSATNGENQGICGTGTGNGTKDTETFIKALNGVKFGGLSDWRLPNVKEPISLVNGSTLYPGPVIVTAWFPNTLWPYYWASTTHVHSPGYAWEPVLTAAKAATTVSLLLTPPDERRKDK